MKSPLKLFALVALLLFLGSIVWVALTGEIRFGDWMAALQLRSWEAVTLFDLVIMLTVFNIWMVNDAVRQGRSKLFIGLFFISAYALGSISPLIYLLIRKDNPMAGE